MCGSTDATPTPGTCADGARRSGSTTSTRRTSFASGCSRSGSSPTRWRTPTRSSTTTIAAQAATAAGCHRPPRTLSSSRSCLQKLAQQLVEAFGPVAAREVTRVLEDLQTAVGRRLHDLACLVDGEEGIGVADGDPERPLEGSGELGRIGPVPERLHSADELVDRPLRWRRSRRAGRPGIDPFVLERSDLVVAHGSPLGSVGADARD